MKTRAIIVIVMTILSISIYGQNHSIGLQGGIKLTNVNSDNFKSEMDKKYIQAVCLYVGSNSCTAIINNKNRTGFSGGLNYEYRFKKYFQIGVDFIYSQNGFKNIQTIFDEEENLIIGEVTREYSYDYLSCQIKGGFYFGKKISGFVNLGLAPSFLISAKTNLNSEDSFVDSNSKIFSEALTKVDFSGLIEIGGSYRFNDRLKAYTSITFHRSFTSLTTNDFFNIDEIFQYGTTLTFGIKYKLKKE